MNLWGFGLFIALPDLPQESLQLSIVFSLGQVGLSVPEPVDLHLQFITLPAQIFRDKFLQIPKYKMELMCAIAIG